MLQLETREQMHSISRRWREEGVQTAFVPTMGNLHDGHLALVRAARRVADRVIASIYVNPTQFGAGEDYQTYPRTLDADRKALEQAGCDLLFIPDHATVYPAGLDDAVRVLAAPALSNTLEGEKRPGHFDGVVTVVARLFNLVSPDYAVFGEKDYQQLLIIRRLVDDLGYDIRIIPVPTVREASGLAMSSRNNYLAEAQREAAGALSRMLLEVVGLVEEAGVAVDFAAIEREASSGLQSLGLQVDYVAIRSADKLDLPGENDQKLRVLVAARSGKTRLIDNMEIIRVGI